ncbi:MAG: metallophosphoesterase [Candidatus Hydrogenedentes bacterium]|nr:metallophosphoesterase [Candidatus Hydrogenedentota bacterium]
MKASRWLVLWTMAAVLWGVAVVVVCGAGTGWAAEEAGGLTAVQLCDTQLGMGGYEHDLATFKLAVQQINAMKPDLVFICGDLVNDGDSDEAFKDFLEVKAGLQVPVYCVPGNHDISGAPTPALLERYRDLVGKDYYAVEAKGFTFVAVNTQLWKAPVAGETEKQDAWLKQTLEAARAKGSPVIVVGHYPLFLEAADEKEEYFNLPVKVRAELLALFKECGVVAVWAGHTHRNGVAEYEGIQVVATATTSRNFDGAPMGYRVWHLSGERPYKHEYVAVDGAEPPADK